MKPAGTGRDIQLPSGLFLIVGTVDLVVIALFPENRPKPEPQELL